MHFDLKPFANLSQWLVTCCLLRLNHINKKKSTAITKKMFLPLLPKHPWRGSGRREKYYFPMDGGRWRKMCMQFPPGIKPRTFCILMCMKWPPEMTHFYMYIYAFLSHFIICKCIFPKTEPVSTLSNIRYAVTSHVFSKWDKVFKCWT